MMTDLSDYLGEYHIGEGGAKGQVKAWPKRYANTNTVAQRQRGTAETLVFVNQAQFYILPAGVGKADNHDDLVAYANKRGGKPLGRAPKKGVVDAAEDETR